MPLMQFYSAAPEEVEGFLEDHGIAAQAKGVKVPAEKWFEAEAGLRSVRALLRAGERNRVGSADRIMADLKEFEKVLERAKEAAKEKQVPRYASG